jgi:hypothetical protein
MKRLFNAKFIEYLIKMENSNQASQPVSMKEREKDYLLQIDKFKDRFKHQVPESKDIRTVRQFFFRKLH